MKKYSLTPEHAEILKTWKNKWINNAFDCSPITDDDREKCTKAAKEIYKIAGLKEPRVVFVQSPFVLRFASGFACAIWYNRKNATYAATYDATNAATDAAYAVTNAATYAATNAATYAATYATDAVTDATNAATDATDAAYAATNATNAAAYAAADATNAATNATNAATNATYGKNIFVGLNLKDLKKLDEKFRLGGFGLLCAKRIYVRYRVGNMASGWMARLSFYRDVAKLNIDWKKYEPWETLGLHTGNRICHPEFIMISEKPCKLEVDEMFQPHCDNGPYIKWRDGTAIYATHGVLHPAWITESPELITLDKIDAEKNADIRQVMISKYGQEKYLIDSGAKLIHKDIVQILGGIEGEIRRALMRDKNNRQFLMTHDGSTDRVAVMSVDPEAKNCRDAHYSISGFYDEDCVANS